MQRYTLRLKVKVFTSKILILQIRVRSYRISGFILIDVIHTKYSVRITDLTHMFFHPPSP